MEKNNNTQTQIRLIHQALNAAVSSVNLAKQLLSEVSGFKENSTNSQKNLTSPVPDLPGVVGTFDGQFMVANDGQKFQVPENYASKSLLVFGDKLKMVEVNGENRFKQIERVKRQKATGLVVKKEGRLHVVTSDGSYRVLPAAVAFFGGNEGDEAQIIIPTENRHAPFAAVEGVVGKTRVEKLPVVPKVAFEEPSLKVQSAKIEKARVVKEEKKETASDKKKKLLEKVGKLLHPAKKTEKPAERTDKDRKGEATLPRESVMTPPPEEKKPSVLIGEDELR